MQEQSKVLAVNAASKRPVAGDRVADKNRMTLHREELRKAEFLALAEAFGTWLNALGVGKEMRGAEGFFEDVDGVVLCRTLAKLGVVTAKKPWDPPRNAFQAMENMKMVQVA